MNKKYIIAITILLPVLAALLISLLPSKIELFLPLQELFRDNNLLGSFIVVTIIIGCLHAAYNEGRLHCEIEGNHTGTWGSKEYEGKHFKSIAKPRWTNAGEEIGQHKATIGRTSDGLK